MGRNSSVTMEKYRYTLHKSHSLNTLVFAQRKFGRKLEFRLEIKLVESLAAHMAKTFWTIKCLIKTFGRKLNTEKPNPYFVILIKIGNSLSLINKNNGSLFSAHINTLWQNREKSFILKTIHYKYNNRANLFSVCVNIRFPLGFSIQD